MPEGTKSITITFSATNANQFPPTITDGTLTTSTESDDRNLTTDVGVGDTVIFQKGGDITSIDAITKTDGSNLFSTMPTARNGWTGVIGSLASTTEESYSVTYTIGGVPYVQDPKLRMH